MLIFIVYLNLIRQLTVMENIFLSKLLTDAYV